MDEEKASLGAKLKKHVDQIEVLRELSTALTECETQLLDNRRSVVEKVRQEFRRAAEALKSKEEAVFGGTRGNSQLLLDHTCF